MSTEGLVWSNAQFSKDGLYRYGLSRMWGDGPHAAFVMLNPSTADASVDDPTIRRCIGFARDWGMDGITVVNLYALRSTDPRRLWEAEDPVGPGNHIHLLSAARVAARDGSPLVAAWGANARADRVREVCAMKGFERLQALRVTKSGAPGHPLYLPKSATLTPWEPGVPISTVTCNTPMETPSRIPRVG